MKENLKVTFIVLFIAWVIVSPIWVHRAIQQSRRLGEAEPMIGQAMVQITQGMLNSADASLQSAKAASRNLQHEWAALPGTRRRAQTVADHVANLESALASRLDLLDRTVGKVSECVASGKLPEATASLRAAFEEGAQQDVAIRILDTLVNRLAFQDFKAATEAAQKAVAHLNKYVRLRPATLAALTRLTDAIERERAVNRAAQQRFASEVSRLTDQREPADSSIFKPVLKGKAMIWDATTNNVETAYELLPDNLRASSQEGTVTIFSVVRREKIVMGHYSVSGQPAYKEKMIITVAYWPEKAPGGTAFVWGGDPPLSRIVKHTPEYGASVNIRNWVASLPRS